MAYTSCIFTMGNNRGGGGGALNPDFGRYVPRQSEKWGLWSELERENEGLQN